MSIGVWIYLWAFYFALLVYISVFVPVPHCLDDCGFVIETKVGQVDSSSPILLFQDCFGYLRFFVLPYKLWNYCSSSVIKFDVLQDPFNLWLLSLSPSFPCVSTEDMGSRIYGFPVCILLIAHSCCSLVCSFVLFYFLQIGRWPRGNVRLKFNIFGMTRGGIWENFRRHIMSACLSFYNFRNCWYL